jgi:hypothetical protein
LPAPFPLLAPAAAAGLNQLLSRVLSRPFDWHEPVERRTGMVKATLVRGEGRDEP